ncbi:N-myristoyl transferase [Coemansia reversa NRRL 1564]|uniref:Glycylpeptide N-tetradecanoyltransferase n=1 Tax=Coemansia reversa (strain ATCC 12441 / NRRL 1564) TaxID=763665 RepID=A0A2G5BB38_COERN|nr:N-myristoyl transferase [Coemansia reversa NRRL 1564]|eukprot:PIA16226.1 N-myristoyl transferase [Coemansia reversa NRRL 1564]
MSEKREESSKDGSSRTPTVYDPDKLRQLFDSLDIQTLNDPVLTKLEREEAEEKKAVHEFWNTQPVPKSTEVVKKDGPLHPPLSPEQIPKEPFALPSDQMEWCVVDVEKEEEMKELYLLLTENYVEDADSIFRFNYSAEFLSWALKSPGFQKNWHVGVRDVSSKQLIAFISGIPMEMMVRDKTMTMAEINFLCLHKSLRGQRMTPLLIKEVTRRIHQQGIFQAVYTVGRLLPKPVATCRYFHRSLNPKKLMETGFSQKLDALQLSKLNNMLRLPSKTSTPGLRLMRKGDVGQVRKLLNRFLKNRYEMMPVFRTDAEISHWFMPRDKVIWTYVVDDQEHPGKISDFFSFYSLASTALKSETRLKGVKNPPPITGRGVSKHKSIDAAYLFYYGTRTDYNVVLTDEEKKACDSVKKEKALLKKKTDELIKQRLVEIIGDALVLAKEADFDVVNCVDMMDNSLFTQDLKFGPGDGYLRYYLFNYMARPIEAKKVGFVML